MAWNETTREKYKHRSERYESDLTDREWRVIEPILPAPSKLGRRSVDLRAVFDAIQVPAADAPDVILAMLTKVPEVRKLEAELAERGLGPVLEIVQKLKKTKDFTVLYRRWVVEWTFA